MFPEFHGFKKISRLTREIIITEKIDGTNGLIYIDETNNIFAGSKSRWLWGNMQDEIHNDNYGFAYWVKVNKEDLLKLGCGYHYGEWMGKGIQRNYGLAEKRFYLFNTGRWMEMPGNNPVSLDETRKFCPLCCRVVPILYKGIFNTSIIQSVLDELKISGSRAVNGFMNPEGIIIYHTAGNLYFKKTIINDEKGKEEK